MAAKITLKECRSLGQGEELWDSVVKGFGIRRQQSDAVSFVLLYRTKDGRQRRFTIGRFESPWKPEEARKEAQRLLAEVAKGNDPAEAKQEARSSMSVAELCEAYMKAAEKGLILNRQGQAKKATTLSRDHSRINANIVPLIGHLKANAVTQKDIREFMTAIMEGKIKKRTKLDKPRAVSNIRGGNGAAARTMSFLGGIFSWAVSEGIRADNPCQGVRKPALAYGLTAAALPGGDQKPVPAPALALARFLALTGWRMGEALKLTWGEVDSAKRIATLTDSKTGRSVRPLSEAACKIIAEQPRIDGREIVFMPAKGGEEATMTGFPKALARIVKAGNLPEDITAHVLRHSFASLAADLGYSDSTIGELIGHRNGAGITRRYIHRSDAVLLAAADAVANKTLELMSEKKPEAVSEAA